MSVFFIADMHFDDENILKYEKRPFNDVGSMNSQIINRWNSVVRKNDTVYVLGDVGATNAIKSLNGTKYLIRGNHDKESNEFYRNAGFKEVYDHPIIIDDFWILSHSPLYINENMPYANLFGHVHNSPIVKNYSTHHFCVSIERISYKPVSFDFIKSRVSKQQ